ATSRCTFFFFFQAEDGIRDRNVTGVQTCALPISAYLTPAARHALRRPVPVTVRHDGDDPREMLAWSILAANCSRVRAGVTLAPGGALDDGLFDVLEVIVRRPDQWLAVAAKGVLGHRRDVAGLRTRPAATLEITAEDPLLVQL